MNKNFSMSNDIYDALMKELSILTPNEHEPKDRNKKFKHTQWQVAASLINKFKPCQTMSKYCIMLGVSPS